VYNVKEAYTMKQKITIVAVAVFILAVLGGFSLYAGSSQTFTGYLADNLCIEGGTAADGANMKTNPEDHTVMCALMKPCIESGYSVLVKNGSGGFDTYMLDKRGNKKAVEFLKDLHREDDIYVHVMGTLKGDTIKVTEIKDAL
jgi:hypothetical protein